VITVLVVGEPEDAKEFDRVAARKPSLEVLHARDVEEAIERLSRNRRIDAVLLLLPPDRAAEVAKVLREEDPSSPPLFAPESGPPPPGVRSLTAATPEALLDAVTRELSG
jgi:DNA-binding response OmpR family regulator